MQTDTVMVLCGCSKSCTKVVPVSYSRANITDESTISPQGQRSLWSLSAALCFSPPVLIPSLAHYNFLTHYHSLHPTCSFWASHIQPRSMCFFFVVRLTPFTVRRLSLNHSLSILLQPRFITAICQCCRLTPWHILWQTACICWF